MDQVIIYSRKVGPTSYRLKLFLFHVNQSSCSWDTAFSKFDLVIQGRGHSSRWYSGSNMMATSYQLIFLLFHVNQSPHSRNTAFQNFTLKIQGQGHGRGQSWRPQSVSQFLSFYIPFVPCQSAFLFLWYGFFRIWPWKSKVKVICPWCCTTTGWDNSIELQMM